MSLTIDPSLSNRLPGSVVSALSKMTEDQQMMFHQEFRRKEKSLVLIIVLAIFFPIQLFLLGKVGLGVAFLLTLGGFGIWWIIEIFMSASRVRSYNEDVATRIITNMRAMGS